MNTRKRITVPAVQDSKGKTPLVAVTAYDYTFARIIDQADIDIVLVGDSLGCVMQGHETTIPVTLDEMIYHTRCVARGTTRALLVADLPFLSYQGSIEQAVMSSGRLMKEAGAHAVKLEGGIAMRETIERLVMLDIPVMGHVGLTPQSYHRMGGHRLQGTQRTGDSRQAGGAERIIADALAVQEAGAFCVVLEGIPAELGAEITGQLKIPAIGIMAGSRCDGQIRVMHDLLGLTQSGAPASIKASDNIAERVVRIMNDYAAAVRQG